MSAEKQKLYGLQAGRGIAAMLVVLHHASNHIFKNVGILPMGGIFHFGRAGVDFFFVLSGFIIYYIHAKDIGQPSRLGRYAGRRWTRIYPIYWIVILIILSINLLSHKSVSMSAFLWDASLLPIADLTTLGVAWTLCFEIFFYVMFALAIISKRLGILLLFLWLVGIAAQLSGLMPPIESRWIHQAVSFWNIEFMLGMFAAHYVSHYRFKWPKFLFTVSLLGFLAVGYFENINFLDGSTDTARLPYGLCSMLIVISLVEWERLGSMKIPKPLIAIGEASYSVYLIHLLFVGITYKILDHLGLLQKLSLEIILMLLFVGAVAGGVSVSLALELPAMRLIRKWMDHAKCRHSMQSRTR